MDKQVISNRYMLTGEMNMLRQKTNLELLFEAKTNEHFKAMAKAKKQYEQVLRGFLLEYVASEKELDACFLESLETLRNAYYGDPYVEDYDVMTSILFDRVDAIEEGENEDISDEMLTT